MGGWKEGREVKKKKKSMEGIKVCFKPPFYAAKVQIITCKAPYLKINLISLFKRHLPFPTTCMSEPKVPVCVLSAGTQATVQRPALSPLTTHLPRGCSTLSAAQAASKLEESGFISD